MVILPGREAHWVADEGPELRDLTVGGLLDEAAARWPNREAIVYTGYEDIGLSTNWTFAELAERSLAVARAFEAAGIERGERVAVWATNKPEWLLLQFGSAYAGVILVPMNPLYRSTEIMHVLVSQARLPASWNLKTEASISLRCSIRLQAIYLR